MSSLHSTYFHLESPLIQEWSVAYIVANLNIIRSALTD